ncbi:hypothetical protein M2459_003107 [Parabacteroides sp. PF5-5]|uniref:DUF6088 family protein n=1 Tax=unclassified Parabacteroides TaxID=2649774 RepID=UPI002473D642|nr:MULTISPECIES: DUF6088 family protein [unclassified Parabacteroides]MDH6305897.1 hypothetical protein [Parabacteroides sp. PH5-39]MDH6317290.1 hypothetical protein [Parabacteroides sp. PF5-13]MDH6320498.1 hypothetical protein [Parabacteroides sp. PH5-13]MDH6324340.1 hypothetical protein [Parabacteroides sp. PH5-8]MDH6328536.1 hypothetical protein [Parabacteroides sp. PH5-41]
MSLASEIRTRINKFPEGKTFGYSDLLIVKEDYVTAAKALERLQKEGLIKKMSKGVFYKPKQTVFGELKPDYTEMLRPYLFENGKRVAYETGYSLYNRLKLTTQVAFRIKIASRDRRISVNKGALKIDTVKSYVDVTDANYKLLELLDALKDIKRIPDASPDNSIVILSNKIKELNDKQIAEMIKYALSYPPRVKALLGAILENINSQVSTNKLKQSLNPLTKFELDIKKSLLPTINNWNIE